MDWIFYHRRVFVGFKGTFRESIVSLYDLSVCWDTRSPNWGKQHVKGLTAALQTLSTLLVPSAALCHHGHCVFRPTYSNTNTDSVCGHSLSCCRAVTGPKVKMCLSHLTQSCWPLTSSLCYDSARRDSTWACYEPMCLLLRFNLYTLLLKLWSRDLSEAFQSQKSLFCVDGGARGTLRQRLR